ncbi:hypothetical protein IFM89_016536 [Coptis chinensis]|uniref:pectinesterase n=1 Tax=Coptis chinensis TaxID=261450 RepID=A0A835IR07_9MAGN|nr:hypothetical protein IFM89_016536 [Coptis chinensis]
MASKHHILIFSFFIFFLKVVKNEDVSSNTYDVVVAIDGSGNYTSISKAIQAIPNHLKKRMVIYVKGGIYQEHVEVGREKTNLMIVGDGIGRTIVRDGRSNGTGWDTFQSATLAGPSNGQAVAMRSSSNQSAYYRCSFLGYQDTLYVHMNVQFYRECEVHGTVDTVFGDATAVFQKSTFYARLPLDGQSNVFTAQGKMLQKGGTGFSMLSCKFAATQELIRKKGSVKTFLGRPWKEYSRTIIINSYIDGLVDPSGWLAMNGNVGLTTLNYREYNNSGPGANTTQRVQWPGYKVVRNSSEVDQYTVSSFINGDHWLPETKIPYFPGLS